MPLTLVEDVLPPETKTETVPVPVQVEVRWVHDETPDLSFLGRFSDRWEEGAVEHSTDPREYRWFIPAVTAQEHFRELRKLGRYSERSARRMATRCVRQDHDRLKTYGGEGWFMMGCIVTVTSRHPFGLEATDSLWGIESDSGPAYLRDVEKDCTAQALASLREKLAKLGALVRELA